MLFEFFSCLSVVGIWPRFIEPYLLSVSELIWPLDSSSFHLDGLKIAHFSDLHFHKNISDRFLKKIVRKIKKAKPDLIVFTGDFICYSNLDAPDRLKAFLQQLEAPLGCFCTFGNHDYASYVSRSADGNYDIGLPNTPFRGIKKALSALLSPKKDVNTVTKRACAVECHSQLISLLEETPFKLLENKTVTLPIGLNVSGLGEMALGRCNPKETFRLFDHRYPGIVLSHNPDTAISLLSKPGNWIFSGHTHGEQIHFPWPKWARRFSQKMARLENVHLTRGLYLLKPDKRLYVNRGIGSHKPFRFCSLPEVLIIQAKKSPL